MLNRPVLGLLAVLLVLTGCGKQEDAKDPDGRDPGTGRAALVAPQGPIKCIAPGTHLYFQLVKVREPLRISYLETGVKQTDLAEPAGVETRRIWVHPKPKRYRATAGTRPWPYGMGAGASTMTGWHDSWDPLTLPDEKPRYLPRGWNYVFVLLEGRAGNRADIRLGWASRSRHEGEVRLGRGVRFANRC